MSGGAAPPLADVDLKAWALWLLAHGALVLGALLAFALALAGWMRLAARPQKPLGREMIGMQGVTLSDVSGLEGRVRIDGREIRAIAEDRIGVGSTIRVVEVDGLIAKVARVD